MTPSEQLVFDLCTKSFLSLWTYANPQRPNGKELCDVLLVFGDRIVAFSVKESALKKHADPEVAAQRWIRTAVDASVDQLLGARRQLPAMTHVIRADGSHGIDLPPADKRQVHLVAVAVGGDRSVPFAGGKGKGDADTYVHVMDEFTLREILGELDTTPDFIHYLETKEAFRGTVLCEGEENLMGMYLHRGRSLPTEFNMLIVEEGLWDKVRKKPEFRARKEEDRVSYWWDDLIERLITDYRVEPERGPALSDYEQVVRTMAAENRFARRTLSGAFLDWLQLKQAGARSLASPSGITYVFATYPRNWAREDRTAELMARCHVGRGHPEIGRETVIGLATEVYDPSGFSFDVIYVNHPTWTPQDEEAARRAREDLGIMQNPTTRSLSVDEFPLSSVRTERNRRKRERRSRR